ncbi:MAG: hypothetical protein AB8H12_00060 [Lewinella sp.]
MKHFLPFLLWSCLLLASPQAAGQPSSNLSFSLQDKGTGAPIPGAFVFFSGSSAGAISDAEGLTEIPWQAYAELVISHLNYETRVITSDSVELLNNTTILLRPRAVRMTAVTVKSSGKFANKRKKWLSRFENAFLGSRRERRGVRILNPEDILFEEVPTGLRAEALRPIKIANEALGYDVSFLLDTFLLTKQKEVLYGGKVFFKDLQALRESPSPGWDAAREKRFLASKSHFFRALIHESTDLEQYEFGQSTFNDRLEFQDYQQLNISELQWRRGAKVDTLLLPEFLSIVNRSIVTKWGNRTESRIAPDQYATSFLRSRSGRFIISHSGILINNSEVEELGYWSEQRVAGLLPTDYQDEPVTPQSVTVRRYLDSLAAFIGTKPQEKVYLQLDKPYYSINNDIWFKAYLLDASGHRGATPSKVLHVELIDPDGNISSALQLHKDRSLSGHFKLKPENKAGVYRIRAYTDYMRNFDAAYFFQRAVSVYVPREQGREELAYASGTVVVAENTESQRPINLRVLPEGGHLIGGLENSLVLHLADSTGRPLSLTGSITDVSDQEIVEWKTNKEGWGLSRFTPDQEQNYWVNITFEGRAYRIPLPNTEAGGMALHVNNSRAQEVFLKVTASPEQPTEGAFLIGHVRGEVFCSLERIQPGEDIAFSRAQIPIGIACFSLFDQDGQLRSTRLFFNDFTPESTDLKVSAPFSFFRPRQKVELEVSWADSLRVQGASLSVAITDRSLIHHDPYQENISNYLLLNSDLPVPVARPDTFLSNPDQRKRFLLDLQLMASEWHRFDWEKLLTVARKKASFLPDTGAYLRGGTSKKGKSSEGVKAEVLLTSLHPQPIIAKQITDDEGMFEFRDLPYLDTVDYVLQAALFDPQRSTEELKITSRKRKVEIVLEERQSPEIPKHQRWQRQRLPKGMMDKFLTIERENSRLDSQYNLNWQIDLEAVTVSARKAPDSRNAGVFNLNRLDWIDPDQSADGLLKTLRPSNRYIRDMTKDVLQAEITDGLGQVTRVPVAIFINGFPASYTRFQRLNANMIDFISINKTYLSVTTRSSPRSQKNEVQDGVFFATHNGFYPESTFPTPNYSVPKPGSEQPDLRTTIHWEPDLRLNDQGKALLSFYAADTPTEYEVRIEGISDAGEPVFATYYLKVSN